MPCRAVGRRAFLGGALAAATTGIAIILARPPLGLWPSPWELAADYRTTTGEQRQLKLAHDVTIDLNTRTSLHVRAATPAADSFELVSGEATFAAPSSAVEVMAGGARASTAAGAEFNVRCDGAETSVTCLSGVVQVEDRRHTVRLGPSRRVAYMTNGLGPLARVDPAIATAWRRGDLIFQNEPLFRVVDEVNRYRPGRIILLSAALGRRRVTAHFRLDRLGGVTAQLKATFGVRVSPLPGGIVLLS